MSDDPIYDRFAAKLADACLIAINSGVKISATDKDCFCPLGCTLPNTFADAKQHQRRPTGALARYWHDFMRDLPSMAAFQFTDAFDNGTSYYNSKYADLALKYRARFP